MTPHTDIQSIKCHNKQHGKKINVSGGVKIVNHTWLWWDPTCYVEYIWFLLKNSLYRWHKNQQSSSNVPTDVWLNDFYHHPMDPQCHHHQIKPQVCFKGYWNSPFSVHPSSAITFLMNILLSYGGLLQTFFPPFSLSNVFNCLKVIDNNVTTY